MTVLYAVHPKWQAKIERAYKLIREFHQLINDDESERKQERKLDQFNAVYDELPKREQRRLNVYHVLEHGYKV